MQTIPEIVLAKPYPSLDSASNATLNEQTGAYRDALTRLLSDSVTYTAIPAGAGSGKTTTLVAIIIGLLRCQVSPESINSISFTNASTSDFQKRVVQKLHEASVEYAELEPVNLSFSTIHSHAIDMLKRLDPYVGGVAYAHEAASNDITGSDESARDAALKMAFFPSLLHAQSDPLVVRQFLSKIGSFISSDEVRFSLKPSQETGDFYDDAVNYIKHDRLTDAGLGAFTNIDNVDPDYSLAVAVDALMRLYKGTAELSQGERLTKFGLPRYLTVDEAQDLDIIQLLYLRALALNGTSIVVVGDPRQTVFEFRFAVSEWPFDQSFLDTLFYGTSVNAQVSDSPLLTNYRSRKQIIDLAEDLSESIVQFSRDASGFENIKEVNDPEESVQRSHPNPDRAAVNARAVRAVFAEKNNTDISFIQPTHNANNSASESTSSFASGPLKRLQKAQVQSEVNTTATANSDYLKKKLRKTQIASATGKSAGDTIKGYIVDLYKRAKKGESVAILTRKGINKEDITFVRKVIDEFDPTSSDSSNFQIEVLNPEKNAPLAPYWYLTADRDVKYTTPFSSVMTAAAIHFFMSWDKASTDKIKVEGLREITQITPAATPQEAKSKNDKFNPIPSLKIELEPFVDGLFSQSETIFEDASQSELLAHRNEFLTVLAEHVYAVLIRYSVLIWEAYRGTVFTGLPCRFQSCATQYIANKGRFQVRRIEESKRFFRIFWEAIGTTELKVPKSFNSTLEKLSIDPEFLGVGDSLMSMTEQATHQCDFYFAKLSENAKSLKDKAIKSRELIYELFSKFYHRKMHSYMHAIAREIGNITRENNHFEPDDTLYIAYENGFRFARNQAKLSTWITTKAQRDYRGLIRDMLEPIRDINIKAPIQQSEDRDKPPSLTFTTIQSSKGLEWDHVLLIMPSAQGGKGHNDSLKSARDLLYVAITRAKRTVSLVAQNHEKIKLGTKNTPATVINYIVGKYLTGHQELTTGFVEFEGEKIETNEDDSLHIEDESSHSELERAGRCRISHYYEHMRQLTSMSPLAAPSYAFFFHSAMSGICACIVGKRIFIEEDPVRKISLAILEIGKQVKLDEQSIFERLRSNTDEALLDYMQTIMPIYFLSGGKRYYDQLVYFCDMFCYQIASIIKGASLFKNLVIAASDGQHQIDIERPVKNLFSVEDDGHKVFLPVTGIPDLRITGPTINYCTDYKTIPIASENDAYSEEIVAQVARMTMKQINLYQGMSEMPSDTYAEIIYVPNILLTENDEIPETLPVMPTFNSDANFTVIQNLKSAVIMRTQEFNLLEFESTKQDIKKLRDACNENKRFPTIELFQPRSMLNDDDPDVTHETCNICQKAIHCHKRKKEEILGAQL